VMVADPITVAGTAVTSCRVGVAWTLAATGTSNGGRGSTSGHRGEGL